MAHSKGFLRGQCPGKLTKSGRAHDGIQQWKCGRCGAVKNKRAPRCWLGCRTENVGKPDHGKQKVKCRKCGKRSTTRITGCGRGLFSRCSYHRCDKVPGVHCRNCAGMRA